jgi:hypothetical protein
MLDDHHQPLFSEAPLFLHHFSWCFPQAEACGELTQMQLLKGETTAKLPGEGTIRLRLVVVPSRFLLVLLVSLRKTEQNNPKPRDHKKWRKHDSNQKVENTYLTIQRLMGSFEGNPARNLQLLSQYEGFLQISIKPIDYIRN